MKAQKKAPELTITEDDAELVEDKVQDQGEEALYVTESQREEIMKKLMEVKETLESLQINVMQQKGTKQQKDLVQSGEDSRRKRDNIDNGNGK
jgi:tetrahydromethanopterin S-methyltransferase subunit G